MRDLKVLSAVCLPVCDTASVDVSNRRNAVIFKVRTSHMNPAFRTEFSIRQKVGGVGGGEIQTLVSPCLSEVRQPAGRVVIELQDYDGVTKSSRYIPVLDKIGQQGTPCTKAHASVCTVFVRIDVQGVKDVRDSNQPETGINGQFVSSRVFPQTAQSSRR